MLRNVKVAFGLLILGCTALGVWGQETSHTPKREPGVPSGAAGPFERYAGDVLIRTDGERIIVMIDTVNGDGDTDGLVDQWFILQGDPSFAAPVMAHLPGAYIIHSPGSLRVSSPSRRERYHFVVADVGPEQTFGATERIVGIGLSHSIRDTDTRIANQLHRGNVSATCMDCDYFVDDPGTGGSGGGGCAAGGTGSSACSVTAGTSGYSCSVACSPNYYACCNATATSVSCKCYRG